MKEWKQERCAEQPDELQLIADGIYMQRRNIQRVDHEKDETKGEEAYTEWVCECREISVSEYNMLKSIEAIDTQAAIDDYTNSLIEEGEL